MNHHNEIPKLTHRPSTNRTDTSSLIKKRLYSSFLPVKSIFHLNEDKRINTKSRISNITTRCEEKPLTARLPLTLFNQKLPPIENTISKSVKRFQQFTLPSSKLIEEMKTVKSQIPQFSSPEKIINLPKAPGYENKKTLILDLDETLIHAEEDSKNCQISLKVGEKNTIGLNIRPFAQDLLKFAQSEFEVIIFTASKKKYADSIIDYLDSERVWVHHRLYREDCTEFQGNYFKNIERLGNRSLSDMIVVDNSLISFCLQIENGVPISSWYNDLHDIQLKILIDYLKILAHVSDVRTINQQFFGLKSNR